jgi:predicted GNAT family acetyltransferase
VYRVGGGLGRVLADRAIQHLHRAVGKKHERCVFTFNDAPTTRKRDVLALFDRVIAKVAA